MHVKLEHERPISFFQYLCAPFVIRDWEGHLQDISTGLYSQPLQCLLCLSLCVW